MNMTDKVMQADASVYVWPAIHGHMLTGEMLTGQMLTGQLLTGQMLTLVSKNRTNAHKCGFVRYNLGMEN